MKTLPRLLAAAALAAAASTAQAELSQASASGFLVTFKSETAADPAKLFQAIAQLPRWWNGQHTYSGDAGNLSMELRAGGCFCERWGDGNSIEHARVIYVARDKVVRLDGALGPLQDMAVDGILNFAIAKSEGGSTLTVTYRVRGAEAALEKIGPIVDRVIGEQVKRLLDFAGK